LLLLAGGLKLLLRNSPLRVLVAFYAASIAVLGTLRLLFVGFQFLVAG